MPWFTQAAFHGEHTGEAAQKIQIGKPLAKETIATLFRRAAETPFNIVYEARP